MKEASVLCLDFDFDFVYFVFFIFRGSLGAWEASTRRVLSRAVGDHFDLFMYEYSYFWWSTTTGKLTLSQQVESQCLLYINIL